MELGVRKFDTVFEIKFGSNNSVKNIKEIEDALLKVTSSEALEQLEKYYILLNKNFPSKDIEYLLEKINKNKNRLNYFNNKEEDNNISNKLEELKQVSDNLSNISLIEPNKFDNDKVCYVKIKGKEKTLYLTVKYQNGYCISEDKYPNPASFN